MGIRKVNRVFQPFYVVRITSFQTSPYRFCNRNCIMTKCQEVKDQNLELLEIRFLSIRKMRRLFMYIKGIS